MTAAAQTVIIILPTLESPERWSLHTGGRVVPSAWRATPSTGPEVTSFGDGGYAIGIDIAPGTYSAPGGSYCYWEQDSDFLGTDNSIISNDMPSGPVTVQLAANAVRFVGQGCGTWTKS